ncbi:hypothetical protein [Kordiimonas marina]|uniref:hypothetical protein n=1 Tax=Kordiimonas marina TaxID=2872312 RepID=UPI001FF2C1DB|nr:hypothetical protein [Kordiimonas marina]MCJ9428467.1 hypothetical protein [Kordiimonas marina]
MSFQDTLAQLEAREKGTPIESVDTGVAVHGLLGWAAVRKQQEARLQALSVIIHEMGLTTQAVEKMSAADQADLEAKVSKRTDSMLQAIKEDALEKAEKKKSVLYRHTPLPREKNTLPGI